MTAATADLGTRAHRVAGRTHAAVSRSDERLRARRDRLVGVRATLERVDQALVRRGADMARLVPARLRLADEQVLAMERRRRAVDPANLLARGWSITTTSTGSVVRSINDVHPGDVLTTAVADGTVTTTVSDVDDRATGDAAS
jgi:exodeoxyribonuclease VII large subunit